MCSTVYYHKNLPITSSHYTTLFHLKKYILYSLENILPIGDGVVKEDCKIISLFQESVEYKVDQNVTLISVASS